MWRPLQPAWLWTVDLRVVWLAWEACSLHHAGPIWGNLLGLCLLNCPGNEGQQWPLLCMCRSDQLSGCLWDLSVQRWVDSRLHAATDTSSMLKALLETSSFPSFFSLLFFAVSLYSCAEDAHTRQSLRKGDWIGRSKYHFWCHLNDTIHLQLQATQTSKNEF